MCESLASSQHFLNAAAAAAAENECAELIIAVAADETLKGEHAVPLRLSPQTPCARHLWRKGKQRLLRSGTFWRLLLISCCCEPAIDVAKSAAHLAAAVQPPGMLLFKFAVTILLKLKVRF